MFMKKIIGALILTFFISSISFAQAIFEFENDVYDFGKVKDGEKVTHVFKFKNVGQEPLQILKIDASCGCTQPEWPKTPIEPGQSSEIKVVFDSENRVGVTSRQITIQSNAVLPSGATGRYVLTLKGEVTT